mgnify:CR=1 FL=1
MSNIIEKNEYPVAVPLIEVGDKVEGGANGAANKQAIALASRTNYLNEQQKTIQQNINGLSADKIGADAKGAAASAVGQHTAELDPHPQYLQKTAADSKFVTLSGANLPNGYLQLDPSGKIPSALLSLISTKYQVAQNKAARLALPSNPNLSIVVQVDIDTLFYLNGGLDPSVEANWIQGQAATVSGVASVFGRTNNVTAQNGDYTTDQITETTNRKFVSPAEKQTWGQKQDQLVSGQNIKTFKGISLLGSGDLLFNYTDFGAAAAVHKHVAADITDFNDKVDSRSSALIKPGANIQLFTDPTTKEVTINASGGSAMVALATVDRLNSFANQTHVVNFNQAVTFNLEAFALKLEKGATNQTYYLDTFSAGAAANYNKTLYTTFNNAMTPTYSWAPVLKQNGTRYETDFDPNVKALTLLTAATKNIVPVMGSNAGVSGYVPFASSEYSSDYTAYRAFSNLQAANGASDCWASGVGQVPTDANPQWIGISLPTGVKITAYSWLNRSAGAVATPGKYKLQGSNDKVTWEDLDAVHTNTNDAPQAEFFHAVKPTKTYQHYRLFITSRYPNNATYDFVVVWRLRLYVEKPVVFQGETINDLYTLDANNQLVALSATTDTAILNEGFVVAKDIPPANLLAFPLKKIVGLEASTLSGKLFPTEQIVIMKEPISIKPFSKINTMVYTTVNVDKTRYAVSPDGVNFYAYANSTWTSLGALKNDLASAKKLAASGMTLSLSAGVLMTLYTQLGISPTLYSVAYGIFPTVAGEAISISQCILNVDYADTWKKQTPAEVEIRYSTGNISFKTLTAGDYKLVYQLQ